VTSIVISDPPTAFPASPPQPFTIAAGTELHRNHSSGFGPSQFNPGMGGISRFAPFEDSAGSVVPSLYAATTREAAAYETVFHDILPTATYKAVPLHTVEGRTVSTIAPNRDLRLYPLFSPELKALGLSKTDLIETPKSTYLRTALWAKALHGTYTELDGLIWTSRQCDPACCIIIFGDRVSATDFTTLVSLPVAGHPDLLMELRAFAKRAGITITV
jgi:hypothetical protein